MWLGKAKYRDYMIINFRGGQTTHDVYFTRRPIWLLREGIQNSGSRAQIMT